MPTLVSPHTVELPRRHLETAKRNTELFHQRIRESNYTRDVVAKREPQIEKPKNSSVLMSYDYHIDYTKAPDGELKLIEINTNASMSLLLDVLFCVLHSAPCLKDSFLKDFESALGTTVAGKRVVIIDETPQEQKLFVEFLMYQEIFEDHGAQCKIVDYRDLIFEAGHLRIESDPRFGAIDLVYNRLTDFYFEQPESLALNLALESQSVVITPHPYDYRALADKTRMIEWSRPGGLEKYGLNQEETSQIRCCLLETRDISSFEPEELWSLRKKLIFKPKSSHAGKGVYRGSSISKGAFRNTLEAGGLAQDFVPAPTISFDNIEFKYDLRFFAFRNEIRIACARLYQGQMTNATTPGGGVTAIRWT